MRVFDPECPQHHLLAFLILKDLDLNALHETHLLNDSILKNETAKVIPVKNQSKTTLYGF